ENKGFSHAGYKAVDMEGMTRVSVESKDAKGLLPGYITVVVYSSPHPQTQLVNTLRQSSLTRRRQVGACPCSDCPTAWQRNEGSGGAASLPACDALLHHSCLSPPSGRSSFHPPPPPSPSAHLSWSPRGSACYFSFDTLIHSEHLVRAGHCAERDGQTGCCGLRSPADTLRVDDGFARRHWLACLRQRL
ncbi:Delta(14)-sterol reductase LBR, partial [Dissostichus eleginoides]